MIDRFFNLFMESEEGKKLLSDIPDHRKEMVRKKLFDAYSNGVKAAPCILVTNFIEELPALERNIVINQLRKVIR